MNKYKAIKVNGKKVQEHRHLMELHIGRKLTSNECVHHKDRDKTNNSIGNLEIKTRAKHSYDHQMNGDLHRVEKANAEKGRLAIRGIYGKRVVVCDKNFTPIIIFPSIALAAAATGSYFSFVWYVVTHNVKTRKGFQYILAEKLGL